MARGDGFDRDALGPLARQAQRRDHRGRREAPLEPQVEATHPIGLAEVGAEFLSADRVAEAGHLGDVARVANLIERPDPDGGVVRRTPRQAQRPFGIVVREPVTPGERQVGRTAEPPAQPGT
jgi:hypothetical protein